MIISCSAGSNTDKDKSFGQNAYGMAEEMFIFGVTTGVFAFLVGIVFAARARRYSQGYKSAAVDAHGSSSASHGE
ncbi:hypothetical protein NVIE_027870 [Nitrososphaera viennensis EN76]|uniref:Uncharacterized protein n=2 Tax=Nitrososphaera viennensis TaxID=1034015 RepID=A0A060HKM0_9ARCH|nr:hypothetical protein NVIE_027870 [Nitrososphaera viennensis EN76]